MASKIKVDQLETADGSGTIALQNQLSGMTTASLPTVTTDKLGTGAVLQVVTTGTFSRTEFTSTSTWTNTNNQLSITPSSTSSKILIIATQGCRIDGSGTILRGAYRMERGTTTIWNTDDFSELFQVRNAEGEFNQLSSITYLDSPSTTSSVTYTIQAYLATGTAMKVWESGYGSNMTLMEIAG